MQLFCFSQNCLGTEWIKNAGSTKPDYITAITNDGIGNLYITGTNDGTGGPIIFGTTTLTPVSPSEIFIAKIDTNGNFLWAKKAGGSGLKYSNSITADASGNIYVTGSYKTNLITFGTNTLVPISGSEDIFITKLDANGNFLWAKRAGGAGIDIGKGICTDISGNLYVTGQCSTAVFGSTTITSAGTVDAFITKLDASGNFIWATRGGGIILDYGSSITTDASSNIYITGVFSSSVATFGSTNLTTTQGNTTMFISKLDNNGNFLWSKKAVSTSTISSSSYGNTIKCGITGNIYVGGEFGTNISLGTTTLSSIYSSGIEYLDGFITKVDANGNFLWAKKIGGQGNDYINKLTTDSNDNIYAVGTFSGTTSTFGTYSLSSSSNDIFITKIDNNGGVLWVKKAGSNTNDEGTSITVLNNGIYFSGNFTSTINSLSLLPIYNSGWSDILVSKIGPRLYSNQATLTCNNTYTWNGTTYSSSGVYSNTLTNMSGCDSISSLILTLYPSPIINANATNTNVCSGNSVILSGSGANTYTWTGGITNGVAFVPTVSNTYSVIGTDLNGCINTNTITIFVSPCTNISEALLQNVFKIIPNPFTEELILKFENYSDNDYDVVITDILGKTIQKYKTDSSELVLKLDYLNSGIYYLNISDRNKNSTIKKVIKQ